MITWENFCSRRRINVELFLKTHSLSNREQFLKHLSARGISPPSLETLDLIFPPPPIQLTETTSFSEDPDIVVKTFDTTTRRNSSKQKNNKE